MARNSRAGAIAKKQQATTSGGAPGHPGLVDPTNLGINLGSTAGDTTSPEMTIGGTSELPIVDAGVVTGTVDLSAAELKGGTLELPIVDAGVEVTDPDLSAIDMQGGDVSVKDDKKKMYNVVEVIGSEMPSKNAKYVGATPSMALSKAARRIHKKNPTKLKFSVLMRRVSPKHAERELYMYDVTMVKAPKPQGFVTFEVDTFDHTTEGLQVDSTKKVQVVQASDQPVFGYINEDGKGIKDKNAKDKEFVLVRIPETNTLSVVIAGTLPFKIYDLTIVRTEWKVTSERNNSISEDLREKYDTASHTRDRENEEARKKKDREVKKKEVARNRAKVQAEKERAAEVKKRARERAAVKKERDAQLKADNIQKMKHKKEAQKAKADAAKAKASTKAIKK